MNRMLYPAPWLLSEDIYKREGNTYQRIEALVNTYEKSERELKGRTIVFPYQFVLSGYSSCQFIEEILGCSYHNFCDIYGSPVKSYLYTLNTGYHRLKSTCKTTYQSSDSIVEKSVLPMIRSVRTI